MKDHEDNSLLWGLIVKMRPIDWKFIQRGPKQPLVRCCVGSNFFAAVRRIVFKTIFPASPHLAHTTRALAITTSHSIEWHYAFVIGPVAGKLAQQIDSIGHALPGYRSVLTRATRFSVTAADPVDKKHRLSLLR
ncbi:hypothetical protein Q3C01_42370 [Bradyrhizobium sp. UFLA05-109]